MTKKAGHILVLVFLALALAFWIIAMATPGWFVFDIMVDISQIEVSVFIWIGYAYMSCVNKLALDMVKKNL